jgi:multidrug efflux system outer membrane protein
MRQKLIVLVALAAFSLTTACRVKSTYKRPSVPAPPAFRGAAPSVATETISFADQKWFEVFKDEKLQELIRTAQANNFDVRDAVARIQSTTASYGLTRANQYPEAGVAADATALRFSRGGNFPVPDGISQMRTFGTFTLSLLSYEADVWGRLRNATDAAHADVLAAEENRNAVMMTIVSQVASAYFSLLELDAELEIARRTLATRESSLGLIRLRERAGLATSLELREGEQLVHAAAQELPRIQQRIEQTENEINLLVGRNPGPVARGQSLSEQEQPPSVPPGLPSALLERRPDIRAAEQSLVASGATIAAARASFFPRITLTGLFGSQSTELTSLFSGPTAMWQFVPQISQPIFTGGRLRANLKLAQAQEQASLIRYERAVQTAFREVSDALVQHRRVQEVRSQQELLVRTLQERARLSYVRYRGGVDSLLNALDADRDLFEAEMGLARTKRDELLALVQLYRALGGGWQL